MQPSQPDSGKNLFERASAIHLVVLDVDGVLTDGRIIYFNDAATTELKAFNVKDGLGISLGIREGLQFGIITARESTIVLHRARELGIQHVIQKTKTKLPALQSLIQELGLSVDQVAYIGDDLPDIPCLSFVGVQHVGLACCPTNAVTAVKAVCQLVARSAGGHGAVREIVEFLIQSRAFYPRERGTA